MTDIALSAFVKESLLTGASRTDIEKALIEAGWSKDQIVNALAEFSDIEFPIPVPRPKAYVSARDAFLYLLMFSMLYLSAYNLGQLLLQFVNIAIPDPALIEYGDHSLASIRFSTAALLVAFPVFLYVSARISRVIHNDPAQRTSAIRKWLTYLTLTIAACIIVGDLIFLLNSLLSGELTVRFILKAFIVGIISVVVFAYYLWTMRKDDEVLAR